ncbi:hypothetical protein B566_EDAN007465 [Ephemera danica]|nr:hypothetical protein B566_EDAN007465 [Ephemera danica]
MLTTNAPIRERIQGESFPLVAAAGRLQRRAHKNSKKTESTDQEQHTSKSKQRPKQHSAADIAIASAGNSESFTLNFFGSVGRRQAVGKMAMPTSSALRALALEYKSLQEEPVEGFRVKLVNDDLFEWEVAIFGPPETLYQGAEVCVYDDTPNHG